MDFLPVTHSSNPALQSLLLPPVSHTQGRSEIHHCTRAHLGLAVLRPPTEKVLGGGILEQSSTSECGAGAVLRAYL